MATRTWTRREVAATLEATALAAGTTPAQVRTLCASAVEEGVRAVCVPLELVPVAVGLLEVTGIRAVTVAGFPRGDVPTADKVTQVHRAADLGADEVDVVMDHGALSAGERGRASADVATVVEAAHDRDLAVKIILETGALGDELIPVACSIAVRAGADWVKTSTGTGPRGASVEDVVRMRGAVGDAARIKAAGGIRTWNGAVDLLEAGADALGCSAPHAVLDGGLG